MQELVAATGVPKSTILHYLNAGLLPEPTKTSRNMAYYSPACVERISFIKMMQSKHRLPLEVIKRMLTTAGVEEVIIPLLELSAMIFGRRDSEQVYDRQAFCRATGLTSEEVEGLLAHGVLQPLQPNRFDLEDVAIGRLLHSCFQWGLTPEDCACYRRLGQEIVNQEMATRRRLTAHLPLEQDAALTLELTRLARALRTYVIDRVFQHRVMCLKGLKDQGY